MIQTKVLANSPKSLDDDINAFLRDNDGVFIDIKFSTEFLSTVGLRKFALLIYKVQEDSNV